MDKIKINNFLNEFPGREFPEYELLSKNICSDIAKSIQMKFSLSNTADGLTMVKAINALSKSCEIASHIGEEFNLNLLLNACGIDAAEVVYINWHRFDKIDRLKLNDLAVHFYDIWYADVDDIDIFDYSLNWILSIRHDGHVKLLRSH